MNIASELLHLQHEAVPWPSSARAVASMIVARTQANVWPIPAVARQLMESLQVLVLGGAAKRHGGPRRQQQAGGRSAARPGRIYNHYSTGNGMWVSADSLPTSC